MTRSPSTRLSWLVVASVVLLGGFSVTRPQAGRIFDFARAPTAYFPADTADGNGAAWGDYDGDGFEDLAVATGGLVLLYHNEAGAGFRRIREGELVNLSQQHFGVSWADVDNDGHLDLCVASGQDRIGSLLYEGDGKGGFVRHEGWADPSVVVLGWQCAWADYDLDGYVDLFISHPFGFVGLPATGNFLFHNAAGELNQVIRSPLTAFPAPYTVGSWADYDQDGDPDLFIGSGPANGTVAPDFLFRNQVRDTTGPDFVRLTEAPIATDSLDGQVWNWADYDNDGVMDVYVTNYVGTAGGMLNNLYHGIAPRAPSQTPTFQRDTLAGSLVTTKGISLGSVWGDFDNDGWEDLYVSAVAPRGRSRLYHNQRNGTFVEDTLSEATQPRNPSWAAAAADVDNDGRLDLYMARKPIPQRSAPPQRGAGMLFRNRLQNGNHWLELSLRGTRSNRAAIGARVRLFARLPLADGTSAPRTQMREVSSSNAFNGHSALRVHFGTGASLVADSLVVEWPSGRRDAFRQVRVDRILLAEEGAPALTEAPGFRRP